MDPLFLRFTQVLCLWPQRCQKVVVELENDDKKGGRNGSKKLGNQCTLWGISSEWPPRIRPRMNHKPVTKSIEANRFRKFLVGLVFTDFWLASSRPFPCCCFQVSATLPSPRRYLLYLGPLSMSPRSNTFHKLNGFLRDCRFARNYFKVMSSCHLLATWASQKWMIRLIFTWVDQQLRGFHQTPEKI